MLDLLDISICVRSLDEFMGRYHDVFRTFPCLKVEASTKPGSQHERMSGHVDDVVQVRTFALVLNVQLGKVHQWRSFEVEASTVREHACDGHGIQREFAHAVHRPVRVDLAVRSERHGSNLTIF
jgi:hypothetical protein